MTNLTKLDETVNQLEQQAEVLKSNNAVFARVAALSASIETSANELTAGNKNFEGLKKDIQSSLKSLNVAIGNLEKSNEKNFDNLVSANKKFLREFEDTVISKLDRFSSDIQVTIRQERAQLQETLQNNILSQFNNLEVKQTELFKTQSKQIGFLRILLFIIISIALGIGITLSLK